MSTSYRPNLRGVARSFASTLFPPLRHPALESVTVDYLREQCRVYLVVEHVGTFGGPTFVPDTLFPGHSCRLRSGRDLLWQLYSVMRDCLQQATGRAGRAGGGGSM